MIKVASSTWMIPGEDFTEKLALAADMGFEGMGFYAFKSITVLMKGKVLWKEAGKFLDLSITLSHYS